MLAKKFWKLNTRKPCLSLWYSQDFDPRKTLILAKKIDARKNLMLAKLWSSQKILYDPRKKCVWSSQKFLKYNPRKKKLSMLAKNLEDLILANICTMLARFLNAKLTKIFKARNFPEFFNARKFWFLSSTRKFFKLKIFFWPGKNLFFNRSNQRLDRMKIKNNQKTHYDQLPKKFLDLFGPKKNQWCRDLKTKKTQKHHESPLVSSWYQL